MGKHSNAPWVIGKANCTCYVEDGCKEPIGILLKDGTHIADVFRDDIAIIREGRANARLISLAPELLEILETIVILGNEIDEENGIEALDKAKKLILKIRGKV